MPRFFTDTHYCIDSITGVPMFGCEHEWDSTTAPFAGGKELVVRTCTECGRYEKWLSLNRKRSALNF
jgi:hypothetical protein